jgi:putative copper export protein
VANAGVLPLLLITGVSLALHRGVTFATFEEPGYGRLLGIKLVLVLLSVLLAALHGISASKGARGARPLAMAGLASSVGIVVFATALVP